MPLERPSRGHGSRVSAFSPAAFRPSAAALLLAPDEDQPGNVTKYAPLGEFGETSWETLAVKCFYILITYHNIIQSNSRYQGFLYIITRLVTREKYENVYYSNPEPTRNLHVSMASCTANTNQFSDLSERVDRRVRMPTAHLIADFLTQMRLDTRHIETHAETRMAISWANHFAIFAFPYFCSTHSVDKHLQTEQKTHCSLFGHYLRSVLAKLGLRMLVTNGRPGHFGETNIQSPSVPCPCSFNGSANPRCTCPLLHHERGHRRSWRFLARVE